MKNALLLFALVLFFSCNDGTKTTNTPPAIVAPAKPAAAPSPAVTSKTYPSVTKEVMEDIFNNCNQVDYIFYEMDFSMALTEKASIQQLASYVATTPASIPSNCKPIGRIIFNKDGNLITEADLYFASGCNFFRFYDGSKPSAANMMTDKGIEHYRKIFENVKTTSKQIQQGAQPPGQ